MATLKVTEADVVNKLVYADERIWRTEDDRLVPDGDPGAFELFAAPGQPIKRDDAVRYGLVKATSDEKQAAAVEETAAEGTVQDVLDAVGDDSEKARVALEAEQASGKPRKSLVAKLEAVRDA